MIQDISPYCFKNTFQKLVPIPENYFFSFREQKILLLSREDGQYCLPTFRIMGFIAELDGSDIIHLERKELAFI